MFALALLGGIAQAQVPQRINYQGYLGNASGQPINAPVQMVFKLYDVASGGTALWTETQASVAVTNGIFNVALGAVTPITLAFDQPYWLGVTVGTDAEMTPRQPLASNPYAMRAKQADGLAPSAPVAGSQVTGTIAGSQISGSLTNATLGGNTLAQVQGQFVAGLQPTSVAANVITTVDSTGLVGNYASLTIDMEGRPVIAYFDATKSDLKVAKCGNANCSAGNTVSIVDSTGNVGKYPSLVIGVDGLPVIAYYDATNVSGKQGASTLRASRPLISGHG
ncbi:MAG: hypothetical protein A3H32_21170 [Betaproteobacteria bacterium RIFCSPLOWO2_02_FULL_63_19]|nr:MAG: hypothetical protein A3H32_21170 [Betaproteobacteria bacterium RIFCSPLOWO2_02_FULL_63_19]